MKTNKKQVLKFLLFLLLIGILSFVAVALNYWRAKDYLLEWQYDLIHTPKKITSKSAIDKILNEFETIKFKELDEDYLKYTKSSQSKYKKLLEDKQYYKLKQADFYKYIVNDFRIKELLPKDRYYKECLFDKEKTFYWLIDNRLLYKLLELQEVLEAEGYDREAFTIRNGHRPPSYNEKVGGASLSQHMQGKAIDLSIGDIDKNGKSEDKDKQIVLDLLDKKIIRSLGGIGKYPGTKAVHFDVRGYRARWDRQ